MKPFYLLIILLYCLSAAGQVNEPAINSVYDYLYRMAEKGFIKFNDYQLPLDRKLIYSALQELKSADNLLTRVEIRELKFYLQDFEFDNNSSADSLLHISLLKRDPSSRFRTVFIQQNKNKMFLDPLVGFDYLHAGSKNRTTSFGGVRMGGYFGNHFGFNISFRDITESGDSIDRTKAFTPEQGTVNVVSANRSINYSSLNFNIAYSWAKGSLNIGKDNLVEGYGKSGNVILSGKVPSYPYFKFDLQPWRWFRFSYFHGWLASDIIDSSRTYRTGSGVYSSTRIIYRSKFIANHIITVTPAKGFDVSVGESIVYSDKINVAYLIPVNFFRAYDHYSSDGNINSGNNSQFFGFISSRNLVKKTHLYAQLFIDEIKISKIFDKIEKRNQIAYTFGAERTDVLTSYLSIGAEYSRVNPFVYNNLIPTQTYTSHTYSLGDWMGNNADRVYVYLKYTPLPKFKLMTWIQSIRKGPAGTLQQQYYQQPQPVFLSQKLFSFNEMGATASYEWLNTGKVFLKLNRVKWNYPSTSSSITCISFGISYGL